jgi:hypothetical protein
LGKRLEKMMSGGEELADWRINGLADWRIGGLADWRIDQHKEFANPLIR